MTFFKPRRLVSRHFQIFLRSNLMEKVEGSVDRRRRHEQKRKEREEKKKSKKAFRELNPTPEAPYPGKVVEIGGVKRIYIPPEILVRKFDQGSLAEGEGSVQLTFFY
jgi:hypothetical protein